MGYGLRAWCCHPCKRTQCCAFPGNFRSSKAHMQTSHKLPCRNGFTSPDPCHSPRQAGASAAASFEVLEAWHLTAAEHDALVRDVLIPLARLHASQELACSGKAGLCAVGCAYLDPPFR